MSSIKNICEIINLKLAGMIDDNPLSAATKLGTLYYLYPESSHEEKELIARALDNIRKTLTKQQVTLLWNAIGAISDAEWHLMPEGNKKPIDTLKHQILREIEFFRHIDNRALIKQGEDINFYREVFIALIRKHLLENNQVDHFCDKSFSYKVLNHAGAEENHLYLSKYINQCATLPLEAIVMLGVCNDKFAELILKDLINCEHKFEISARFAEQHETLRRKIADDWRFYKATYSPSAKVNEIMKVELKKLECFDEFKDINTIRNERAFEKLPTKIQGSNFEIFLRDMGITGVAYATLAVLCPSLFINPVAPVVAVGLGLGIWAYETSDSFRQKTIEFSKRCIHASLDTTCDFRENAENRGEYHFRHSR